MLLIGGCDEVGRGACASEVYACVVVITDTFHIEGLADSKLLTAKKRERLAEEIKAQALCWSLGTASVAEIEELNIHHATLLAMARAVEGLKIRPDKVFVDGIFLPKIDIPCEAVVDGDQKIAAISAASIIAKVSRDEAMVAYHKQFPEYGFDKHKGYFTKEHAAALRKYGPCLLHRKTFAPVRDIIAGIEQLAMF